MYIHTYVLTEKSPFFYNKNLTIVSESLLINTQTLSKDEEIISRIQTLLIRKMIIVWLLLHKNYENCKFNQIFAKHTHSIFAILKL